jgi:hypothetical protein
MCERQEIPAHLRDKPTAPSYRSGAPQPMSAPFGGLNTPYRGVDGNKNDHLVRSALYGAGGHDLTSRPCLLNEALNALVDAFFPGG